MPVKSLIETVTFGSGGAASIEFTDIPQDAADLILVLSLRSDYAGAAIPTYLTINSDNATSYSTRWLRGNGATVDSGAQTAITNGAFTGQPPGATTATNTFSNTEIYFANYTSTEIKNVSINHVSEDNATTAYQMISTTLWPVGSGITGLRLDSLSSNFVQHCSASLYSMKYD